MSLYFAINYLRVDALKQPSSVAYDHYFWKMVSFKEDSSTQKTDIGRNFVSAKQVKGRTRAGNAAGCVHSVATAHWNGE